MFYKLNKYMKKPIWVVFESKTGNVVAESIKEPIEIDGNVFDTIGLDYCLKKEYENENTQKPLYNPSVQQLLTKKVSEYEKEIKKLLGTKNKSEKIHLKNIRRLQIAATELLKDFN